MPDPVSRLTADRRRTPRANAALRGKIFAINLLVGSARRLGMTLPAGLTLSGPSAGDEAGMLGGQHSARAVSAANRWRERGAEARAIADRMLDGPARATMYDAAARYDTMARLAGDRE